jgi:hypothetical protein
MIFFFKKDLPAIAFRRSRDQLHQQSLCCAFPRLSMAGLIGLQGRVGGKQADCIDLFCEALDTVAAVKGAAALINVIKPALTSQPAALPLAPRNGKRSKVKARGAAAERVQTALKVGCLPFHHRCLRLSNSNY